MLSVLWEVSFIHYHIMARLQHKEVVETTVVVDYLVGASTEAYLTILAAALQAEVLIEHVAAVVVLVIVLVVEVKVNIGLTVITVEVGLIVDPVAVLNVAEFAMVKEDFNQILIETL